MAPEGSDTAPTQRFTNDVLQDDPVWLETAHAKHPIRGGVSIGRSPRNNIVLDSAKVSRRHAIINPQTGGEYWLVDLGSSNGTFLNHRRLNVPVRLSDQDQIVIGDEVFIFHQPQDLEEKFRTTFAARTIRQIENIPCWLLVADIEGFTPLSRSLTSDVLATIVGTWLAGCKDVVEKHAGAIDKYLGDGFLAYWRGDKVVGAQVVAALNALRELQAKKEPTFRVVLHFGFVAIGGAPSMGEESLMGKEVNFIFRMEKLAGSLGIPLLMSAAANAKVKELLPGTSAGAHELKGFEGKFEFFSC